MFDLTIVTGEGKMLRRVGLTDTCTLRVGRSPECEIHIPDPKVSRQHAEIRPVGDRWVIRDLDSTHGVFVQGQRIRELTISPGLEVRIGSAVLTFGSVADSLAAEIAASIPDED